MKDEENDIKTFMLKIMHKKERNLCIHCSTFVYRFWV